MAFKSAFSTNWLWFWLGEPTLEWLRAQVSDLSYVLIHHAFEVPARWV